MAETDYHVVTTTLAEQAGTSRPGSKLARENRILLLVCFVAVVLLGPMFMAGYLVGRKTAVAAAPPVQATTVEPPPPQSAVAKRRAPSRPKTAAQAKAEPASEAAIGEQPALHGTYLQLAATPRDRAFVERLRKNGFDAVALEIPARPGMYRVLVGPLQEGTEAQVRTELESKGLPGKSAIPRVF